MIKTYADGIGPEKSQLIDFDNRTNTIKPSQFFTNARNLGLFMHPYTFRIDSLPVYSKTYGNLLKIFIDTLNVDGLFTDFSDLTLQYINNSAPLILNFDISLLCGIILIRIIFNLIN